MRVLGKTALLLVLVMGAAACSSSGTIQMRQDMTAPIPPGKTVVLTVVSEIPADADKDAADEYREVNQRMKATLFGRLMSEGVFKQVLQPGETGDYRMAVSLKGANKVSQGARIFAGVFAGSNSLNASVELYEQNTNSLVTAFEVEGKSAAHPLSSEAGLDDAVREAVDEILLALQ